jgi:hypothetical protein
MDWNDWKNCKLNNLVYKVSKSWYTNNVEYHIDKLMKDELIDYKCGLCFLERFWNEEIILVYEIWDLKILFYS